jgi:uncharacterized protein YceH (UPF0502 family)
VELDSVELRVLGCLIEKQRTTPDQYPLSLNALRLAANQSTNRDPVVEYDEATIRSALDSLGARGWTRLASGPSSRAAKFRHLLDDALQLTPSQLALLAVLMLRGAQTAAELRTRSERLYPFRSVEDVESALAVLAEAEHVQKLPRRPGEREERWTQLFGATAETPPADATLTPTPLEARLADLERRLAALEARLPPQGAGTTFGMTDEEELTDEETDPERDDEPSDGEPWAKTSSGDADEITDD